MASDGSSRTLQRGQERFNFRHGATRSAGGRRQTLEQPSQDVARPISTNVASGYAAAIAWITATQRTGRRAAWSSSCARVGRRHERALAVTFAEHGPSRDRATPRRRAPRASPASAGCISGEWNAPLTLAGASRAWRRGFREFHAALDCRRLRPK
jgi:hypothetical protein